MSRRRLGRAVAFAVLAVVVILLLTPTGRYLVRAAWEEGRILARRRPIAELARDSTVNARTRAKLRLVLTARGFAVDSVRLAARESFTTFSALRSDTLVLVLSGAYKDRLERYTWWFPVVGRVPYKGYFDFGAARRAAAALARRGFDVYLRPSPAFSTLGWFNDPLLSTTLHADSVDLANTVIHELTHNTFYAPGQAVFNESFANFVGSRGASWLFRSLGDTTLAAVSDARWEDDKRLDAFYGAVYHALDSAFRAHPGRDSAGRAARLAARETVYARARQTLVRDVGPQLRTIPTGALGRVRLDNAVILARRIYLTDLGLFDAVWEREGRDLRRTIARVIALAKSRPKDPYGAVKAWLAAPATALLPAEATAQDRPHVHRRVDA